jgi:ATP-dependent DNA helicase RecG
MFGNKPKLEIMMATFASKEKLTFNDINRAEGRVIDLVDAAEKYIRNTMRYRVIIDGTQLQRKEIPEVPHVAIREALLNSFCHKNFRTPQSNEVAIYSDRIEIYNPGTFPIGTTPDDYIKGRGRTIHRNPLLALIMYYSKDIEKFGTGLKRIADACEEADIRFEFISDNYGFTVIFYRPPLWTSDKMEENISNGGVYKINHNNEAESIKDQSATSKGKNCTLNCTLSERAIIEYIILNPTTTQPEIATAIRKSLRSVKADMAHLHAMNIIKREGSRRDGRWVVKVGVD